MLVNWLLAAAPIGVVIILMLGFRRSASAAGLAGWITALAAAGLRFGAGPVLLVLAQGKALLFAGAVLYLIWMALWFYHALKQAGAFDTLSRALPAYVTDHTLQALLLAWAFGGFLEGVAGFGVPTAIVAPLLVAAGYGPVAAAIMASIGEAWAVTFGGLGNALLALAAASHRQPIELGPTSALVLGLAVLGGGLAILWTIGGLPAIRRNLRAFLVMGIVIGLTQYALSLTPFFSLAVLSAGFAGVVAAIVLGRGAAAPNPSSESKPAPAPGPAGPPLWLALAPYALLVVIVIVTQIFPPLTQALNRVMIQVDFPEMRTALGFVTPAGAGRTISIFGHTGALMAYATALSLALFAWQGKLPGGLRLALFESGRATVRRALPPTLGILAMVAMAVTMENAGMTLALAQGLSQIAGLAFPLVTPFIGALGAFMTGSNVNSNVIFTSLQQTTAQLLSLNPVVILAAQTTGGAVGGAFAPAKIMLVCSTVGLSGQEGKVLKPVLVYGVLILAVVGVAALATAGR
jgi:lactate permease